MGYTGAVLPTENVQGMLDKKEDLELNAIFNLSVES